MNLFIYFKDVSFFKQVVKPFVESKKEKKLVDFYLLDDIDGLKAYMSYEAFDKLNKLELALLA